MAVAPCHDCRGHIGARSRCVPGCRPWIEVNTELSACVGARGAMRCVPSSRRPRRARQPHEAGCSQFFVELCRTRARSGSWSVRPPERMAPSRTHDRTRAPKHNLAGALWQIQLGKKEAQALLLRCCTSQYSSIIVQMERMDIQASTTLSEKAEHAAVERKCTKT